MTISATATGVHQIFGHWSPEAYMLPTDQVSVKLAKSVLTGRKSTSYNGWGQELTHIVSEPDLNEYKKIIYPFISEFTWFVKILFDNFADNFYDDALHWKIVALLKLKI